MTKNSSGLYIHIPFCEKKCSYCDFNSWVSDNARVDEYIDLLIKEIENSYNSNYIIDTIFIGGGTPSILSTENIYNLSKALYKNLDIKEDAEFTIEANPNSISKEKIKAYEEIGINRISLGAQSLDESILKSLGRIHKAEDIYNAIELIKNSKIDNFNIDFILGVPNEDSDSIEKNLEFIKKYEIPHVSYYSLILEENTKLYNDYINGIDLNIPDEETERKRYYYIKENLESAGYHHYEISNFSIPAYECKHNLKYWNLDEYMGFGVSAAGFLEIGRYKNFDSLKKYRECILNKKAPRQEIELLNNKDLLNQKLFMGLRLIDGIKIEEISKKFNIDFMTEYRDEINKNIKNGYIIIKDDRLKLTNLGLSFSNLVELDFYRL